MAQRAEQEDVIQRPAVASIACPAVRMASRVARTACVLAVAAKPIAADGRVVLRPAVFRLPFRLRQQDAVLLGALLQRLSLGWHVMIHPIIKGFESHNNGAQGQIADRRHPSGFSGEAGTPAGGKTSGLAPAGLFGGVLGVISVIYQNLRLAAPSRGSRALAHLSA